MRKRLLVLGGAGFIGSHVAEVFLQQGWEVGVIDGLAKGTGGARGHIAKDEKNFTFVVFEKIDAIQDLAERVQWADTIVDAIAFTGHLVGFEQPRMDVEANLLSHLRLIETLKGCPGKRVIYMGSRGQYGVVTGEVITEDSPCLPLDPQGINKLSAEHFFRIYGKAHQFHTASLRLTNCFGPRQRVHGERGLVGGFIQDVLDDRPIEIFGNAARTKNVLYGEDAAKVVFDLAQMSWTGFDVFNVGGAEVSIQELLERIFQTAGKGSYSVKPFPEYVKRIDVGEARFSDEKLRRFLGKNERTPLSTAINLTVDYFKQNQQRT